ncbi:hypothetical protein [Laspinema olomoucense]|uniref:Uncharacterized protein n=1 Tax=Laspinema olomoucense D3b TaxID=2953688 RepID=A0ABT2NBG4_9CYAN|nr:hypothetical protein [Laspinema sp. D3b]MCT7979831.1 hypothetical protein [Laspinema sp. D3b]
MVFDTEAKKQYAEAIQSSEGQMVVSPKLMKAIDKLEKEPTNSKLIQKAKNLCDEQIKIAEEKKLPKVVDALKLLKQRCGAI